MQKIDSQAVTLLRFPMICLVVCIHTNIMGIYCPWLYDLPVFSFFIRLFVDFFCGMAVPMFFFLSGLLFFREGTFGRQLYKSKLKKRVRTLLVPFIAWNIIYFLIVLTLQMLHPDFQMLLHKPVSEMTLTDYPYLFWDISQITHLPTDQGAPIVGQFWFLQCLMLLVLFSPIIWLGIHYLDIGFLVLLAVVDTMQLLPSYPGVVWYTYFYFSLGAYFSIKRISPYSVVQRLRPYLLPCAIAMAVVYMLQYSPTVVGNSIVLLLLFDIAVRCAERGITIPALLTSATFFLFASHRLFSAIMTMVARREIIPIHTELAAFAYYLLGTALVIGASVLLYYLMNRFFPTLTSWLTGGRKNE